MDPLSITASGLGVTGAALSSISNIRHVIGGIHEANDVMQNVTSNLEAIELPLSALEKLQISDSTTHAEIKEVSKITGVAEAVNECGQACAQFEKKLEQWTKHSSTTEVSLRDRLSVSLWKKEKIKTFRTRVLTCQAIVHFTIESAQLLILVRSGNASKAARQETEKKLRVLETAIQEHIELTKRAQEATLQRKKELESPEDEDEDEDGGAQRTLAIQETEERSRVLEADQTASSAVSQILSKLSVQQVASTYHIAFSGINNGGMQIGHNTATVNWTSGRT